MGGEKKGLFSVEYQAGMAEIVKGVPISPASSQINIEVISFGRSFKVVSVCNKKDNLDNPYHVH